MLTMWVSVFFMFESQVEKVLKKVYDGYMKDCNKKRIEEQQKLYAYYTHSLNTEPSVATYLDERINVTFTKSAIERLQKLYLNITKQIINKIAIIYKNPAKRELVNEKGKVNEDVTNYYNSKLPVNINTIDKDTLRYGHLYNTFMTQTVYDEIQERFMYLINPMHKYDVEADHYNTNLTKVSYLKYFDDELFKVVWTPEEHYRIASDIEGNESGEALAINSGDGTNPYGVIPFPYIRMTLSNDDFWGTGYVDVVNMNEQINFLLTFFENDNILLGTSGVWVGTNLGLDKKADKKNDTTDHQNKITFGLRAVLGIEEERTGFNPPNLQHVSANPPLAAILDSIERLIKLQASNKGLNPNAVLGMVTDTSDYQKFMDFMGEMEVRLDDLEPCRAMEQMRFDITRKINNALYGKVKGIKKIDEKLKLKVDFVEPEIVLSPSELQTKRDWEKKNNLSTPADWLMEDNPDIKNREEAETEILKNKKLNAMVRPLIGFQDLNLTSNTVEE